MDAAELIAVYDEDGDGLLNEEETVAALEANRPEGPPPREGMRSESAGSSPTFPPGFERYQQAAAMGMEQNQTNNWFYMGGSATGNGNAGGWFSSVNTWS